MENVVIRMCDIFLLPDAAVERGPPSGLKQGGGFADLGYVCLCMCVAKISSEGSELSPPFLWMLMETGFSHFLNLQIASHSHL